MSPKIEYSRLVPDDPTRPQNAIPDVIPTEALIPAILSNLTSVNAARQALEGSLECAIGAIPYTAIKVEPLSSNKVLLTENFTK